MEVKEYPLIGVSLLTFGLAVVVESAEGDTAEDGRIDISWSWWAIIWSGGGLIWSSLKNA